VSKLGEGRERYDDGNRKLQVIIDDAHSSRFSHGSHQVTVEELPNVIFTNKGQYVCVCVCV
jgi:hypothetical protein